eukprot:4965676-Lingulodinium_polyedra.AAC.1
MRLEAMRKAYYSVAGLWRRGCAPWRWKRCVLICRVVGAALSCIEAFTPSPAQYRRIDLAVAALGRKAMRGKACTEQEGRTRSLSTEGVLEYWKIAPASVEAQ